MSNLFFIFVLSNSNNMTLTTTNGHDEAIVKKFNEVAQKFDNYDLLEIILNNFCDDQDLEEIIDLLEEKNLEKS